LKQSAPKNFKKYVFFLFCDGCDGCDGFEVGSVVGSEVVLKHVQKCIYQ
jgi:hypothetical protein